MQKLQTSWPRMTQLGINYFQGATLFICGKAAGPMVLNNLSKHKSYHDYVSSSSTLNSLSTTIGKVLFNAMQFSDGLAFTKTINNLKERKPPFIVIHGDRHDLRQGSLMVRLQSDPMKALDIPVFIIIQTDADSLVELRSGGQLHYALEQSDVCIWVDSDYNFSVEKDRWAHERKNN